ncbi:MAG TPA: hypothetical protein VEU28_05390, partial [Actinomycetota bacterium]|nr:hypothetical protein [Actinomycetota bacterium]
TVAFGLACLWALAGEVRRSGGVRALGHLLKPYLAGAVAATLAVAFFYSRSTIRYPEIAQIFQQRATTNFCQAFAFSYQQRNPEWAGNPFVDGGELMAPTFGPAEEAGLSNPGFTEALRRNPGAVLDYLRWNARLVPNGIQLALFGGTSRPENPDYVPMPVGQTMPWLLSIACLLVLLGGAWAYQNDSRLWKEWIRNRRWPLLALACPALGVVIVMIQQRPRPSYMFAFTLLLMVLLGFSAFALLRALDATDVLKLAVPLVAAALLVAAPARYNKSATPLKDSFVRLEPYAEKLGNTAASVPGYGPDLCRYLSVGRCRINDYWANVRPLAEAAGSLDAALNRMEVALFYADAAVLSDPVAAEVVDGANPRWEKSDGKNGEWALFERVEGPAR